MKIELSYKELIGLVKKFKDVSFSVIFVDRDRIEINYFVRMELIVKKIDKYTIALGYELNGVLGFLAKGFQFLMKDKFSNLMVELDTGKKELIVHLDKIEELKKILGIYKISSIYFDNTKINLELELNA